MAKSAPVGIKQGNTATSYGNINLYKAELLFCGTVHSTYKNVKSCVYCSNKDKHQGAECLKTFASNLEYSMFGK